MGYQIDNTCYANKQLAENVYFSKAAPMIDVNGNLHQFTYTNHGWLLNGQQVSANLPECSIIDNIQMGAEIGWLMFGILAVVWGTKRLIYIFR